MKKGNFVHGALVFIISMVLAVCLFGSFFVMFTLYTRGEAVEKKQEDIPYKSEYIPSSSESLSFLLLGCEMPESLPGLAVLVRYNAPKGEIVLVTIPTSVVCKNENGRKDTLKGHYDYEGVTGSVNAVKSLFGIELDRYMRFQKSGLSNMTDFFGGVPYTVLSEKSVGGELLPPGEQLLDGRRLTALLFEEVKPGVSDSKLQAELLKKLLGDSMDEKLSSRYEDLVSGIFYNCETNVSQNDLAKRQTGFLSRLKLNEITVSAFDLKGNYSLDYSEFYPNSQSLSQIKERLE